VSAGRRRVGKGGHTPLARNRLSAFLFA